MSTDGGHLQCPFCGGYEVDRLYLAMLGLDSCACHDCDARWDERRDTGEFAGRGSRHSVLSRRPL